MPTRPTPAQLRCQLRALAVLEDELSMLFVQKVAAATKVLSWEEIADATGVTKQAAWRRWKALVNDPSTLRRKRDVDGLRAKMVDESTDQLSDDNEQAVLAVTEELARRLIVGRDDRPWSNALRRVLHRRGLAHTARQESAVETHFFVSGMNLFLATVEQAGDQAGGVYATLTPAAEAGLQQGIPPKMERVSFPLPDQLWAPKDRLDEAVTRMLDKLLVGGKETGATALSQGGRANP
jgi:hypothetical protein